MTMKVTVNGVDIEIEGAVEVEVDGKTVKIKTRERIEIDPWWYPPRTYPSWPYHPPSWTIAPNTWGETPTGTDYTVPTTSATCLVT